MESNASWKKNTGDREKLKTGITLRGRLQIRKRVSRFHPCFLIDVTISVKRQNGEQDSIFILKEVKMKE